MGIPADRTGRANLQLLTYRVAQVVHREPHAAYDAQSNGSEHCIINRHSSAPLSTAVNVPRLASRPSTRPECGEARPSEWAMAYGG